MRLLFVAAALLAACLFTAPASAAQGAGVQVYLGKTVTDVEVEIAGVAVAEPGLLELIETRVAEPLGMREIRRPSTPRRLGRFEDVARLRSAHRPGSGATLAIGSGEARSPKSASPATPRFRNR